MKAINQQIQKIRLSEVTTAPYQRQTNTKQIMRIVNNFSEAKLGMPVVSERGGQFYIIDGNHRVAALRRLGYTETWFIVLSGMTYEEEADYFRKQNENTRQLSLYTRFKAALEAGDAVSVKINSIVEQNGFEVGTVSRFFNTITAIYALNTVYDMYGADNLDRTLKVIRAAWEGNTTAKNRELIVGVSEFLHRFDVDDFPERIGRVSFNAIWQEYLQYTQYQHRATDNRELRVSLCRILVKYYNKGYTARNKKYLHMEAWHDNQY
jgi:hypothetical protein